jgi:lactate dehydrogenase-like 2-hydroxyacid dehydrogenase
MTPQRAGRSSIKSSLTEVLKERRIAGAGLDVLEQDPPDPNPPTPATQCGLHYAISGFGRTADIPAG